jgi:hypothetical protein
VSDLHRVCKWCAKPTTWDYWLNVWVHDDTRDSTCSGAPATIDTKTPPAASKGSAAGVEEEWPDC